MLFNDKNRLNGKTFLFTFILWIGTFHFIALSCQVLKQNIDTKHNSCCNEWESYLPDTLNPALNPTKYFRINFHYIFEENSKRQLDTTLAKNFALAMLKHSNNRLANNQKMVLPAGNNTPVLPLNVQLELTPDPNITGDDGIYFHWDSERAIFNKNSSSPHSMFSSKQYEKYGIQKGSVCNVFFLEHPADSIGSKTYGAKNNGVGTTEWVKIAGVQQYFEQNQGTRDDLFNHLAVFFSCQLNHEVGHSMGLGHTWKGSDGCEDTPNNSNCFNLNFPANANCDSPDEISNNIMDYNSLQLAITPCQIGKVEANFHSEAKNYKNYLVPLWCTYDPSATITIEPFTMQEWKGHKNLQGDLIIGRNAELHLYCRYSMPEGAKIILSPRSKIVLHNATIFNRCNEKWDGIIIKGKKKNRGQIIMDNNSQIINNSIPILETDRIIAP